MRFPQYHLAASVVNRILNVADQVREMPEPTQPPQLPNTTQSGQQLDKALATPPPAVPAPEGSEFAIVDETLQGGSAADAVGSLAAFEALP